MSRAPEYSAHETMSALLHLSFCVFRYGPKHPHLTKRLRALSCWRGLDKLEKRAKAFLKRPSVSGAGFASHVAQLDALFNVMDIHEMIADCLASLLPRVQDAISRVSNLDRAAYYYSLAHGLRALGLIVDVSSLNSLSRDLPSMRHVGPFYGRRAMDAFNYCTHFVLYETHYLHASDPSLPKSDALHWLLELWSLDALNDPELLAEYLNCLLVSGPLARRPEVPEITETLLRLQLPCGSWRVPRYSDRYTRFHATWCAGEALHLSWLSRAARDRDDILGAEKPTKRMKASASSPTGRVSCEPGVAVRTRMLVDSS
jgi:hypothetical protein